MLSTTASTIVRVVFFSSSRLSPRRAWSTLVSHCRRCEKRTLSLLPATQSSVGESGRRLSNHQGYKTTSHAHVHAAVPGFRTLGHHPFFVLSLRLGPRPVKDQSKPNGLAPPPAAEACALCSVLQHDLAVLRGLGGVPLVGLGVGWKQPPKGAAPHSALNPSP